MIIDAHMHLWNKLKGDIGEPVHALKNGLIRIGNNQVLGMPPYILDCRATSELFISFMDAAGVDAAVVTQEYLDGEQNAYLAEVERKYPGRFFVHGLLEFRKPNALAEEFNEVMKKYRFRGLKVPAGYLAVAEPRIMLTDRRLMEIFARMKERRMVLSIDLDYGGKQVNEMRAIAKAFPQLTIALGHFAMANREGWLEQLSLAKEPNVYIESGGITWLFRNEGPPFPGAQEAFREAVNRVGAEKLMWGSDFPRTMVDFTYTQTLDFLLYGCEFLSDDQKEAILGGTAMKLFGFTEPSRPQQRIKRITEID